MSGSTELGDSGHIGGGWVSVFLLYLFSEVY